MNENSFEIKKKKKEKTFFVVSQVLSINVLNQNSKNVGDTTFK